MPWVLLANRCLWWDFAAGNPALMAYDGSRAVLVPHLPTKFCFCVGRAVLLNHEEIKFQSQSVCVFAICRSEDLNIYF